MATRVLEFSGPHEVRRYLPGDEVRIKIELEHRANIDEIELILVNRRNRGAELSLRLDLTPPEVEEYTSGGAAVSSFELSRVVPPEAPSGFYDATVLRCRTVGGLWIWKVGEENLDALERFSVELVAEDLRMRVLDYEHIEDDD